MLALWLENGTAQVRHDAPDPPTGEAIVRVLRAGICNTDLELIRGYYPFTGVLGHEFVGIVDEGPDHLLGRRVVGEINAVCGTCKACRAGRTNHCLERTVLGIVDRNGAFAERLALPQENLHPVPAEVSSDAAVFTEPLAAALEIQEQISLAPTDRVLVVGDGKLGLLIAQTIALTECQLLVKGRHDEKLALLQARGIATTTREVPPGSFDVAVECTGNADGFAEALRALRARGALVMKSTYASPLTVDAARIVVDELTLVGSRCGPFDAALRLLQDGAVDVESLIHARYPLEDALAALDHARRPGTLKVLLEIGR